MQMWVHDGHMDSHNTDRGIGWMSQWEDTLRECFKCAGQPFLFDEKNSHGSGRGSIGGDATTGGRCALCLGVNFPASHKCRTMLS
jgi:hypothetical protein